ncbi:hypothetical protein ACIP98_24045 [Streptomyces sp. NPDC088354]|uniref:hypothetical protein n=1 Tax=unclassified Streptomyces TaxID=2593676 RepID=UPI0029B8B4EA|nr:hypothetical protein [Streptomyces sp. MI02-7b]MDX3076523.1 hypothetical protein [Streptomyces sp. MI02-7b]
MVWEAGAGILVGVLLIMLGTLALWTAWILPRVRHRVTSPRLYGLGAVAAGAYPVVQGLVASHVLPGAAWEVELFSGIGPAIAVVLFIAAGRHVPSRRPPATAIPRVLSGGPESG